MSEIIINGIRWYECFYCGHWTYKLICECREESKSKAIIKFLNIFRKKNKILMLNMPKKVSP